MVAHYSLQIYKARRDGENEGILRSYQRKLLKAIDDIRKTKQEQRKMVDSQVTVLEVGDNQGWMYHSLVLTSVTLCK